MYYQSRKKEKIIRIEQSEIDYSNVYIMEIYYPTTETTPWLTNTKLITAE